MTRKTIKDKATQAAEERLLDLLLPPLNDSRTREKLRYLIREGKLHDRFVEITRKGVYLTEAEIEEREKKIEQWEKVSEKEREEKIKHLLGGLTDLSKKFPAHWFDWCFKDYVEHDIRTARPQPERELRKFKVTVREALAIFFQEEYEVQLATEEIEENEYDMGHTDADVVVVHQSILEALKKDYKLLYGISHRQFEELLLELLTKLGFYAELTATTRDGGCDLIAFSKDSLGLRTKYIIEAKHYSPAKKVGVGIVRQLNTVKLREGGHHGILVTSSYFTRDAVKENKTYYGLDLRDYARFADWIKKS